MKLFWQDRLFCITLLFIAAFWSVIVYETIPAGDGAGQIGPRAFPLFWGLVLAMLAIWGLVRSLRQHVAQQELPCAPKDKLFAENQSGEQKQAAFAKVSETILACGIFALIIGYGFLLERLGFLIATPVVTLVVLAGVLRIRKPVTVAGVSFGITLGCWAVFGQLLGVYLPVGSWVSIG